MQIGRFQVFEQLAIGGFGIILRAFDPVFQRPCALKIPHPHVLTEPAKRQRFLSEARKLERLNRPAPHPNVVCVFDADECGGVCYIAMELCELGSLDNWLAGFPRDAMIPMYWAADLVRQIAAGVQHAHEHGIYHRDLKPANILLAAFETDRDEESPGYEVSREFPRLRPKVADFGLAKSLEDSDLTPTGALLGTRAYMAPELFGADPAAERGAADVWALGVILYELLTRRKPFEGPSEEAFLRQTCSENPIPPRAIRDDLPRGLNFVCLKCLEKVPRDRYHSPSELANELKRILDNLEPLGRPVPHWKRIARGIKRHPVRAAFSGMAMLGLLGGASVAEIKRQSDRQVLLANFVALGPTDLATWVPKLDPRDGATADFLAQLYRTGTPDQRLAAALVMAGRWPERYAEDAFGQLLDAEPPKLRVIADLLKTRMPGLAPRLEGILRGPPPDPDTAPEVVEMYHRRQANAACASILVGPGERGWSLLPFTPDPQTRSFLVQTMGPAGVDPHRIYARLSDPATEASVRRALIQSFEGVAEGAWDARLRQEVTRHLLSLYEKDPDSGVHGSAKWLLRKWKASAELDRIDGELAGKTPPEDFQWRISVERLTLVTIDDPRLDRVIEVLDTEIPVALYLRFRPNAFYAPQVSPEQSCPINGVSYYDAADFCNWLGGREGLAACYRPVIKQKEEDKPQTTFEPITGHYDLGGYRLPTDVEFKVLCGAGTRTRRYYGDSDACLDRYAWTLLNSGGVTHPVGGLIPNDLGLFDTLGNLQEWCERSVPQGDESMVVVDLRGGYYYGGAPQKIDVHSQLLRPIKTFGVIDTPNQGFRVARTKSVRAELALDRPGPPEFLPATHR